MRALPLVAAALLAAGSPAVAAPTLSLNGVNIDGATSQRIENATVVIDEQGNVNIVAKGYSVASDGAPGAGEARGPAERPSAELHPAPPAPPASALTRRYFLLGEQSEPDGTQYDIAVFVNERWIKELRSADEVQQAFEVTSFLVPGPNKVVLVATKRLRGPRRSSAREVTFRVVLGEAAVTGGQVTVESPAIEMRRSAAETQTFTQEYLLLAR